MAKDVEVGKRTRLGDLVKVVHGWPFKSSLYSEEHKGGPIVVSIGNFNYSGGFRFDSTTVKEYDGEYPKEYELKPNDILLIMTCQTAGGEILGVPARIPDDGRTYLHNQRMGKVVFKDTLLHPDYFYYLALSREFNQALCGSASGSKILHTSPGRIEAFEFELPSLREQLTAAQILRALDDKIELNRRMNGTLEALAQAVFKEWFVEKAEEGWEETCLAAQVEVAKGLSYKGSGLADAGRPMHNLNSIYEFGRYKYEGIKWYTGEFKERHLCKAGDVIVANTEQGFDHLLIGSAAIIPKHFGDEGLFTHHIYRVRPLPTSYLTNHFLYLLLSHPAVREQVQGYTNGTTVNSLAKEGLERPTFKLPPKALVEKFDAVVAPLFARQEANYEETQTLTALRDALLPKLMRGEVRVKQTTVA